MRSRAVASAILTAIVLGLAWARLGPTPASADRPHPGLDFSIAVFGVSNCDTKSGDATCNLAPGSTFVVDAILQPLPSDIPSYEGFDIVMGYSGVTPLGQASSASWPDCVFAAVAPPRAGQVAFGCAVGIPPTPSTYTGIIGTAVFSCDQSGSVNLVHGPSGHFTDLVQGPALIHAEDPQTTETLTINCVAGGVTPIPTTPEVSAPSTPSATQLPPTERAQATATARTNATAVAKVNATAVAKATSTNGGAAGGGGGGLGGGVIAIIVIAAVAVAGGAGFFGWRYLQSRTGAGGGT